MMAFRVSWRLAKLWKWKILLKHLESRKQGQNSREWVNTQWMCHVYSKPRSLVLGSFSSGDGRQNLRPWQQLVWQWIDNCHVLGLMKMSILLLNMYLSGWWEINKIHLDVMFCWKESSILLPGHINRSSGMSQGRNSRVHVTIGTGWSWCLL